MYIADESEQLQYSDCQFSNVDLELAEEVTSRHLGRARAARR